MSGAGSALMGTGSSRGDDRAVAAAEMAISSPLLEASIDGAHGVLLSIQGGSDLGLFEINEAAQLVSNSAAVDANIIFGAVIDDALGDEVRVTVIAAGLDQERTGRGTDAGVASFAASASPVPVPAAVPAPSPAPVPRPAPSAPPEAPEALTHSGNGSSPAVAAAGFAGSILGAPVPDDGIAASSRLAAEASPASVGATADEVPEPEPARPAYPERSEWPERAAMATDAADSSSYRPAHAEAAARTFDVAATRRRPVVFEEDDDLDVPDFLK
jgi:cell division protein FtsZ